MTLEAGKPLLESRSEVQYGRSFLDYYAAEAVRPNGFLVPSPFTSASSGQPRGQIMALQQAVGVTAMLTPWNFPLAMLTRKIGPALAAGCTAVVKPSELTPLTALAVHQLALQAGIPEAVVQVITPNRQHTPGVGQELCTHPHVAKISFTGSTPVGRQLMQWSSGTVKRLSLELGGNAPFVVFNDADLEQAVAAAVASKFRNAGQTCVCSDRFLVQAGIHDDFVHAFQQRVQDKLSKAVGAGLDDRAAMGPLITPQAVETVHGKVQAAIHDGAKCLLGGTTLPEIGPHFYAPTILTHVSTDSLIWTEETFGPVAAIRSFETEEEAVRIANDSRAGLASYVCTHDLGRAFRLAQQ
jgi:succinate-semialdehyde dehydrogenase/glutarate-semialdehyde dehydrogenase